MARTDLLNILDDLDRDPEFRTTTELLVARHSSAWKLFLPCHILEAASN
ncbi:hypothetical protein [Bacillus sp. UNC41MFS5]|nr:hypothetical protein [Bacillus sp. UNC41MFS5]